MGSMSRVVGALNIVSKFPFKVYATGISVANVIIIALGIWYCPIGIINGVAAAIINPASNIIKFFWVSFGLFL